MILVWTLLGLLVVAFFLANRGGRKVLGIFLCLVGGGFTLMFGKDNTALFIGLGTVAVGFFLMDLND